jgi:type I restriction enzyme R subunit
VLRESRAARSYERNKAAATFVRAFTEIAQDLTAAGCSDAEAVALRKEVEFYAEIRAAIKKHSGEELDIKPYEADMRHLLNTYIQADPETDLAELADVPLTELIIETGIHDAIARKLNEKGNLSRNAIAEGIINNVRKTIIRDQLTDPRFYDQMSKPLDDLIQQSRADTAEYEEFLRKAESLVKRLAAKHPEAGIPAALHGKREATVIYNNLPRIFAAESATASGVPEPRVDYGDRLVELALEIDRLGEIAIAVTRKDIKHVHLSVHPPRGRVTPGIEHATPAWGLPSIARTMLRHRKLHVLPRTNQEMVNVHGSRSVGG